MSLGTRVVITKKGPFSGEYATIDRVNGGGEIWAKIGRIRLTLPLKSGEYKVLQNDDRERDHLYNRYMHISLMTLKDVLVILDRDGDVELTKDKIREYIHDKARGVVGSPLDVLAFIPMGPDEKATMFDE